MKLMMLALLFAITSLGVMAQQPAESGERRVALTDTAVALDAAGASALEGSLRTTALNGTTDSPVTNIRMVVKNSSTVSYALVSGLVTMSKSRMGHLSTTASRLKMVFSSGHAHASPTICSRARSHPRAR